MKKYFLIVLMSILCSIPLVYAQGSRQYIKDAISKWGSCRNVAITKTGGDLALNGRNAYAYSGIPSGLSDALEELHDDNELIDDVQLTENGNWLILWGNNGFRWSHIPYGLESELQEYNERGEVVTSVTFNDLGDWIVISTEHVSASDYDLQEYLGEGMEKYGQLWSAHLTNDGLVLCYERGYRYLGNVPANLKEELKDCTHDIYRIKFLSDVTYFISDKNGWYSYYM